LSLVLDLGLNIKPRIRVNGLEPESILRCVVSALNSAFSHQMLLNIVTKGLVLV